MFIDARLKPNHTTRSSTQDSEHRFARQQRMIINAIKKRRTKIKHTTHKTNVMTLNELHNSPVIDNLTYMHKLISIFS